MTNTESLMIFFDGSAKKDGKSGIGYVIQTISGRVLEEFYGRVETTDSMVAEATAAREAVRNISHNYPETEVLYIKGDNRGIIDSLDLNNTVTLTGRAKPIIEETREMLHQFEIVSSTLVKDRELNSNADDLAEDGRTKPDATKISV